MRTRGTKERLKGVKRHEEALNGGEKVLKDYRKALR